ncbi:nuclear transport factor 2 family protein [Sphaerisporangium rubeum]|uniref:Ketosteroid isomerase-like protein n=1 Tax=Sphaerisporangium rubeum TaxID=321317 RepID=A0A7X0IGM1_9ACTN|nr:nuclear transport factor 2 family protein [Sphaerisporangium rubeum]MBB6474870.1 ketosteroid isomerase-like protein [Sphaerisporangium rubeum]
MTTRDQRDQVRRLYELIDERDFAGLAALFDKDAVYHRPGCDVLVGRDGIERFYTEERTISSGAHTLSRIIVSDRDVAVEGAFEGALDDGRQIAHRFAELFRLSEEGLFTRRDSFLFVSTI